MNDSHESDVDDNDPETSVTDDFAKVMAAHYGDVLLSPLEVELMMDSGLI